MRFHIQKLLNNNLITLIDQQAKQILLMPTPIPFHPPPPHPVHQSLIHKLFPLHHHSLHHPIKILLLDLPYDLLKLTQEIIQ
ncbi:CAT RNA binding domain-containing protein, partial [Bacillus pumilus]|uniref:CAT RNA binding domain-containing protein n=1 Tax=Bacillus pumilus TaxID=1408 RepID=UPI003704549C